jgi:predicted RNase H-like HicB family nuclease
MTKPLKSPRILQLQITVVLEPDGAGFHAFCPALKGLHVDGENESKAIENAKDAIMVYLDSLVLHGDPLPICSHLTVKEKFELPQSGFFRDVIIPWPILQMSGIS